jgi:hypothetical protein
VTGEWRKLHNEEFDELRSGKGLKIKVHRACVEQRTYTGRPFIIERKRIQFQIQRKNIEGSHSKKKINKHKCCQLRRHDDDMITNPTEFHDV